MNQQQSNLVRVTVTLPRRLTDQLAKIRDAHRVSVSSVVELALESYLRNAAVDPRVQGASLRRRRGRASFAAESAAD